MRTALSVEPIDAWAELQRQADNNGARCGAVSSFVGVMRNTAGSGRQVHKLLLEHYPGMSDTALAELASKASEKWPIDDVLLLHRVGEVLPGEVLVVIGVWAVHRAAAFAACEWLIEALKQDVPLWKKEFGPEGARWVGENTPGRMPESEFS